MTTKEDKAMYAFTAGLVMGWRERIRSELKVKGVKQIKITRELSKDMHEYAKILAKKGEVTFKI